MNTQTTHANNAWGHLAQTAPQDIGKILATVVTHIASKNVAVNAPVTPFHSPAEPNISLESYIQRMDEYMHCSRQCFIIASVLITRLEEATQKQSLITPYSAHRLVLTAVVLAAKCNEDVYLDNKYYADVGGITLAEMNELELYFLTRLSFRANVTPDQYEMCRESLNSLYSLITDAETPQSLGASRMGRVRRASAVAEMLIDDVVRSRNDRTTSMVSETQELLEEFTYGRDRTGSVVSSMVGSC